MPSKAPATRFRFRSPDPDSVQKDYLKTPANAGVFMPRCGCSTLHAPRNTPAKTSPTPPPLAVGACLQAIRATARNRCRVATELRKAKSAAGCDGLLLFETRYSSLASGILTSPGLGSPAGKLFASLPSGPHCVLRYAPFLQRLRPSIYSRPTIITAPLPPPRSY